MHSCSTKQRVILIALFIKRMRMEMASTRFVIAPGVILGGLLLFSPVSADTWKCSQPDGTELFTNSRQGECTLYHVESEVSQIKSGTEDSSSSEFLLSKSERTKDTHRKAEGQSKDKEGQSKDKTESVQGYTRNDGKHVSPYKRREPR